MLTFFLWDCARFRDPEEAFNRGDFTRAADFWLQRAERGDRDAACRGLATLQIIHDNVKARPLSERVTRVIDSLTKGFGELNKTDQEKALQEIFSCFPLYYRRAADAGNANAQYLLAETYRGDEGKASEMERLTALAAEGGSPEAQFNVGSRHLFDADSSEKVHWWGLSAAQGYYPASQNLGRMYQTGDGVPQDFERAAKLFLEGAQQGFSNAQMELGELYAKGQGVPQDFVQAHLWFNLAGAKASEIERRRANEARDNIARSMTTEQIASAQRLARDWRPKEAR